MRNTVLALSAAAALAGGAAPAMAQTATPDQADTRCLMVLQFIGRDPKQAEQASRGVYFYLGRLASRGPISRLEALMKAEAPKMNEQTAQTELTRCSGELNARTKEYQAVNQRLAAAFGPPPSAAPPAKK